MTAIQLYPEKLSSAAGSTSELSQTGTTKELPAARVPVPVASVTERTTQLIATEKVGTRRE
ncbi:MAG TPA: hypothetical protein VKC61_14785 [Pyrinomonadaceae bacterium]|nr:hypothetical protein [Pyrinomonadaceae bacterium]